MTISQAELSEVQDKLTPLIGKRAWQPNQGIGSFLTFEFGAKIPEKPVKSKLLQRIRKDPWPDCGEWHLWIYMCAWRIERGNEVLASSEDDRSKIGTALQSLDDRILSSVKILSESLDTSFIFGNEIVLRTFSTELKGAVHWKLFTPDQNVLALGPGSSWSHAVSSSCCARRSTTWRRWCRA